MQFRQRYKYRSLTQDLIYTVVSVQRCKYYDLSVLPALSTYKNAHAGICSNYSSFSVQTIMP